MARSIRLVVSTLGLVGVLFVTGCGETKKPPEKQDPKMMEEKAKMEQKMRDAAMKANMKDGEVKKDDKEEKKEEKKDK